MLDPLLSHSVAKSEREALRAKSSQLTPAAGTFEPARRGLQMLRISSSALHESQAGAKGIHEDEYPPRLMQSTSSSHRHSPTHDRTQRGHALRSLSALTTVLVLMAGCSDMRSTTTHSLGPVTSVAATGARPCNAPTGVTNIMLRGGGAGHAVRIFVPSAAKKAALGTLPVVIDWPGLGLTGAQQALISNYEPLAQAQGFEVVHPTGVRTGAVHEDSWQLVNRYDPQRNDLAFANTLINTLIAHWCVNPARVIDRVLQRRTVHGTTRMRTC